VNFSDRLLSGSRNQNTRIVPKGFPLAFRDETPIFRGLHHGSLLVSENEGVQNVPAAEAPPAIESPIPAYIDQIEKLIRYHQASTPWTLHGYLLAGD
jgi:hypothetical protein